MEVHQQLGRSGHDHPSLFEALDPGHRPVAASRSCDIEPVSIHTLLQEELDELSDCRLATGGDWQLDLPQCPGYFLGLASVMRVPVGGRDRIMSERTDLLVDGCNLGPGAKVKYSRQWKTCGSPLAVETEPDAVTTTRVTTRSLSSCRKPLLNTVVVMLFRPYVSRSRFGLEKPGHTQKSWPVGGGDLMSVG